LDEYARKGAKLQSKASLRLGAFARIFKKDAATFCDIYNSAYAMK